VVGGAYTVPAPVHGLEQSNCLYCEKKVRTLCSPLLAVNYLQKRASDLEREKVANFFASRLNMPIKVPEKM
jgi:hypothetical protein